MEWTRNVIFKLPEMGAKRDNKKEKNQKVENNRIQKIKI